MVLFHEIRNTMPQEQGELKTDIITLTAHIMQKQQVHKEANGDFSILLTAIGTACKWISNVVRKAELLKVIGYAGGTNVQEEQQQKLDVLSNEIMVNLLTATKKVAILISEELEEAVVLSEANKGVYCVVFDPLDGSSNIDCGVAVGTIFGIYHLNTLSSKPLLEQILQPGSTMISGGYCMYGSSSVLVLAVDGEANGYTLDPNIGEFLLTHPKMKIGEKKIYSMNEGYAHSFSPAVKGYVDSLKYPSSGFTGKFKPYAGRYVGSMVADMHRTLLYGGIFLYPSPKLRMLYECFPMAMLVEACGGAASNGTTRILDLTPAYIHDRSPIFLGNKTEVGEIEEWFRRFPLSK